MSALEQVEVPRPTRREARKAVLEAVEPVKHTRTWPKGVFPLLILGLLASGMVGHLVLQTRIQEQAFELAALQTQADQLSAQSAILQAALDKQSTPQQLAYAASHLGMVANPYSTFLVLPSGKIEGLDIKVKGNEVPIISAAPTLPSTTPSINVVGQAAKPATSPAGGQQ